MDKLTKYLNEKTIDFQDLLLDPNNPRFSELGDEPIIVQEARYAEEKIQKNAYEKMRSKTFDVLELRDTIKTLGFLQMDRMVVRKWNGIIDDRQKYVVIEGNRRLTAIKWLVELHEIGKESLDQELLNIFSNLQCLVLADDVAPKEASLILPGLRHVSGVKPWGAYQKAKAIYSLRKSGLSAQEAAQSLGLSTRAANQSYKCFLSLEQMKADEEYGEYADPKLYSYFEEVFRKQNLRKWLDWSDEDESFNNQDNLQEFYSWIIPGNDDSPPKLPESKSVRDLAIIIDDDSAFQTFKTDEGTIARAYARYEINHPEEWQPTILAAIQAIKNLTPVRLRGMTQEEEASLNELKYAIDQAIVDRQKLIS